MPNVNTRVTKGQRPQSLALVSHASVTPSGRLTH